MSPILKAVLGAALALGATGAAAQAKPPADKAPDTKASGPATAKQVPSVENFIAMCAGCHGIEGYKTAFPTVYHVPMIGGQSPTYLANALKAYRSGERSHPSMRGIAGSLTDEQIQALAEYYGGKGK